MCLEIDEHFLEACYISISFDNHPGVEQDRIDAFKDEIATYKDKVKSSVADYAAVMPTIAEAFANISTMKNLWAPVMSHLSESPGEEKQRFNNEPLWTTWVKRLNTVTATCPDLLIQIRTSPTQIYTDREWNAIRDKVAFLDETIDYAYTNKWGAFGERGIHLGTETNNRMPKGAKFTSSGAQYKFEEETNNNPKYGTWRDALPTAPMNPV